jgi:hypothetical protein
MSSFAEQASIISFEDKLQISFPPGTVFWATHFGCSAGPRASKFIECQMSLALIKNW